MKLILKDEGKAQIYGLPTNDCDADDIVAGMLMQGWKAEDVMRHIDAAVAAGAFEKGQSVVYPTRPERVMRVRKEATEDKE